MNDLLAALCRVQVIEGLMPMAFPDKWKAMLRQIAEVEDRTIRRVAIVSVVLGLLMLQWVRAPG